MFYLSYNITHWIILTGPTLQNKMATLSIESMTLQKHPGSAGPSLLSNLANPPTPVWWVNLTLYQFDLQNCRFLAVDIKRWQFLRFLMWGHLGVIPSNQIWIYSRLRINEIIIPWEEFFGFPAQICWLVFSDVFIERQFPGKIITI